MGADSDAAALDAVEQNKKKIFYHKPRFKKNTHKHRLS